MITESYVLRQSVLCKVHYHLLRKIHFSYFLLLLCNIRVTVLSIFVSMVCGLLVHSKVHTSGGLGFSVGIAVLYKRSQF